MVSRRSRVPCMVSVWFRGFLRFCAVFLFSFTVGLAIVVVFKHFWPCLGNSKGKAANYTGGRYLRHPLTPALRASRFRVIAWMLM